MRVVLLTLLGVQAFGQAPPPPSPAVPGIQVQLGGRGGGFNTVDVRGNTGGQQTPAGPVDPEKRIRLEGKVLSAAGAPLRKATVTLQPAAIQMVPTAAQGAFSQVRFSGMPTASTDENGAFILDNVQPGNFLLLAERTGFVPQHYGARTYNAPGTPLTLKEGDKLTKLDIVMTAQGVISGRVLDQDGDPVAGLQVQALRYAFSGGQRQLRAEGVNSTTDFRGDYVIFGLMPGRYYVQATLRPQQQTTVVTNVTTYFPSSLDLRGAAPVDVAAGAELNGMTVRLRREKVYSIRGTAISAESGAPVSGASIMLLPPDQSFSGPDPVAGLFNSQVQSDREGKFEIRGVVPGSYALFGSQGGTIMVSFGGDTGGGIMFRAATAVAAGGRGGAPSTSGGSGRGEVTVGSDDATTVLALGAGATITGSVHLEKGSLEEMTKDMPPQPTLPEGALRPAGFTGFAVRLNPTQGIAVNAPGSSIDANGAFTLANAAPAIYYVAINGLPSGYYVKSVRFSGQDITRSPLDLLAGGGGQLDITLAKGTGEISGGVMDDKGRPLTGVTVSLWPQMPSQANATGGVRTATTDQDGAFKFTGATPGEYRLAAFEELPDAGLGQYAPFLSGLAGESITVKLTENGAVSSQLKPVSRDKLLAEIAKLP